MRTTAVLPSCCTGYTWKSLGWLCSPYQLHSISTAPSGSTPLTPHQRQTSKPTSLQPHSSLDQPQLQLPEATVQPRTQEAVTTPNPRPHPPIGHGHKQPPSHNPQPFATQPCGPRGSLPTRSPGQAPGALRASHASSCCNGASEPPARSAARPLGFVGTPLRGNSGVQCRPRDAPGPACGGECVVSSLGSGAGRWRRRRRRGRGGGGVLAP